MVPSGIEPELYRLSSDCFNQLNYRTKHLTKVKTNLSYTIVSVEMSDNKYLSADTCIYHGFYAARILSFLEQPAYSLAGAKGIEPIYSVLETDVLPLNYAPMAGEKGFEPLHDGIKTRCRNRLATPPCKRLKACCNDMLVYRILL